MSVKRICEVIMRDEISILPVSHMIHGVYDIDGVSLSMPAIVGADGIESDIPINLSGEEALKLKESADSLKKIIETMLNYKHFTHGSIYSGRQSCSCRGRRDKTSNA